MTTQNIYFFGDDNTEGDSSMKSLLGGKGANLAEMARIDLPVPPGFTITTDVCTRFQEVGGLPDGLMDDVRASIARLEKTTGKTFGGGSHPLLVSVRSGAPISMPGMMDTVLNLGLNSAVRDSMEELSGSGRFVRDSHRRFIQMFGNVVKGLDGEAFEHELSAVKKDRGVENDYDLSAEDLDEVIRRYMAVYEGQAGESFPEDPWDQLEAAIHAVFQSWGNPRAITYRRLNRISDDLGTAVNVQAMAYGNLGNDCGTGVGFTRDPSNGTREFYGEYLVNAQGEDVVAGIRTPLPVRAERAAELDLAGQSLQETFPAVFDQLMGLAAQLEKHYKDVQDIEFTIEHERLYLLQTRTAKRTGHAWLISQTAMVDEGLIEKSDAVTRVPADALTQILAPTLNPSEANRARHDGRLLAIGLNAGPGAAQGTIAFTADDAAERTNQGQKVILVREETTPEDIHGMDAAQGILTARGGLTSHAAVVARGMGKPCVVGCSSIRIDSERNVLIADGREFSADDLITIDGTTGEVFAGTIDISASEVLQVHIEKTRSADDSDICQAFDQILNWADDIRTMGIRTNADTPKDSEVAIALGAEGIGLCRTEHMFFDTDRIRAMRQMILSRTPEEREAALRQIEPMQAEDFRGIFRAMGSRPVTIRTLDPPLHEFLPHGGPEVEELAQSLGMSAAAIHTRIDELREMNPMLGHRGCRLGLMYPQITRMQARAIITAALDVAAEGIDVHPEIMIPLVGNVQELSLQKEEVIREAEALFEERGQTVDYMLGTMIEVPRAALTADEVAAEATFFSFGTNDLTQMTLGVSRDDAGSFLPDYVQYGIYPADPFASIDTSGVGILMQMAVDKGRQARPDIKLGICGEHGGDPSSIQFCAKLGLHYVSCSPYRVPIARLAAAQAALASK
ncbi:MAG: pyruvate, phosphate dikinase [Myxococcales bacterium]|nr:pyruvate, phosphate dikinase [Myxococcales bacterium]